MYNDLLQFNYILQSQEAFQHFFKREGIPQKLNEKFSQLINFDQLKAHILVLEDIMRSFGSFAQENPSYLGLEVNLIAGNTYWVRKYLMLDEMGYLTDVVQ